MSKKHEGLTKAEIDALEDEDTKSDEQKAEEEAVKKKAEEEAAAAEAEKKAEKDKQKAEEETKKKEEEAKAGGDDDAAKKTEEEAAAKKAEEEAKAKEEAEAAKKKEEDEAAAKAAEESEVEDQEVEFTPQTIKMPVMTADELKKLDSDLATKLENLNGKLKDLKGEFDAGDMSSADYVDKRDAIKDEIYEAKQEVREQKAANKTNVETNNAVVESNWQGALTAFFKKNPLLKEGLLYQSFAAKVDAMNATPEGAKMTDMEVLQKCRKDMIEEAQKSGIVIPGLTDKVKAVGSETDAEAEAEKEKAAKIAAAKKANSEKDTKNLGDVSSEQDQEQETWEDELDKMDAPEREEALAKMTQKQRDQYLGVA